MKPLLLIDVDGPLNPYAAKAQRRPEGYRTHRMRPTGWTEAEQAKPLRVWLNPDHGAELLALAEVYELVWATTWKDEANDWIGPHLGLPRLPFIDWPVMHGRRRAAPSGRPSTSSSTRAGDPSPGSTTTSRRWTASTSTSATRHRPC